MNKRPAYWKELFRVADQAIGTIREGKLDPYESVNRLIRHMKEVGYSSSSAVSNKFLVLRLLRYSKVGVTVDDAKDLTIRVRRTYSLASKVPSTDQVRAILMASPLKAKVLVSMLISSGARMGEILRVRVSDIDFLRSPARLYIREREKFGRGNVAFLSAETVFFVRQYLNYRKEKDHKFLFTGYRQNVRGRRRRHPDKPLNRTNAWGAVRMAFDTVHLDERSERGAHYYSSQAFRRLSISLMKAGGFPADWAEHMVGHSIGVARSYLPDIEEMAKEWLKVENRFCFLFDLAKYQGTSSTSPAHEPELPEAPSAEESRPANPNVQPNTSRWISKSYGYVKTTIKSPDYDIALAEGYRIFDRDDNGLRVLRKRNVSDFTLYPITSPQRKDWSSTPIVRFRKDRIRGNPWLKATSTPKK